jgi:glutathione S-transferase
MRCARATGAAPPPSRLPRERPRLGASPANAGRGAALRLVCAREELRLAADAVAGDRRQPAGCGIIRPFRFRTFAMIQLHYNPGSANMAPHIVLNELGLPFELVLVDTEQQAHKRSEYLKLNPNGLVPVLVDDDLVLYEAAAICLHLADRVPSAGLAPALGTPERAHYYKWMVWLTNTLQATLIHYFYSERMVAPGNTAGAAEVKHAAQVKVGTLLEQIEVQLAGHGQPWLLGDAYSAVDAYCFMLCRWTRNFSGDAAAPARTKPAIGAYLERMMARPAVQKMFAAEGLQPPLY